jgi:signal transduction histidine kinase
MVAGHRLALIALFCDLLLGVAVFIANSNRPTSRSFLLLTFTMAGWLVCIDYAFVSQTPNQAAFWIKLCSALGPFTMPSFALLRTSIIHHEENWRQHLWRLRWWFLAAFLIAALALSPAYLKEVRFVATAGGAKVVPQPVYGWAGHLQVGGNFASVIFLAYLLISDQFSRRIQGVRKVELQFILLACLTVLLSVIAGVLLERVFQKAQSVRFAPLRVVLFHMIVAYGISSRGILHVRAVFRLALSYLLLAIYAGLIFSVAWFVIQKMFAYFDNASPYQPALFVAVLTALLFNATGTPVRRFTKKLLPPDIDFEQIFTDVSKVVQSVTTLEALIDKFALLLGQSVGSPQVRVFLCEPRGGCEHFVHTHTQHSITLRADDPLIESFREGAADAALEELQRQAPGGKRDRLLARMDKLEADLILPVRFHGELTGILTLEPRPSGHIYGRKGRATLRLIAEQLGVAIANARLYTEARQSQAYNQFLVEHLSCGVIATDEEGNLTVVNPEARRLLLVDEQSPPTDIELPEDIAQLIQPALAGDSIAHDEEIVLRKGARDQTQLRVSCLPFAGEQDRLLGVVLVLNDHTALDRLQRQVRQADRLASIGTLASGMAHEIKNPLTALKTFTQLLPRRYADPEFRHSFTDIVGGEIGRIERIVNQLLAFARPAPLLIEQVNLHDVIANSARLISPQAARHQVELRTVLRAESDYVAADKDMLQQVLLNLLLNALQAIEGSAGGWIEVSTDMEPGSAERDTMIRVDVRDNGKGISQEALSHIFDPFFTTKSEGTGLGLSVSYNIIMEHRGRLEAQSKPGEGACFSIYLPVC